MRRTLFTQSIFEHRERAVKSALHKVETLSDEALLSGDLPQHLHEIVKQEQINVATMRPDERRGKRRIEDRIASSYGERRSVKIEIIDVSIPYSGDHRSFDIAPSQSATINVPVEWQGDVIKASFADDDNLERNVNSFIDNVTANLRRLEQELETFPSEVLATIERAAAKRADAVRSRHEKDRGRSFPID